MKVTPDDPNLVKHFFKVVQKGDMKELEKFLVASQHGQFNLSSIFTGASSVGSRLSVNALHVAIMNNHPRILSILIVNGVDINFGGPENNT